MYALYDYHEREMNAYSAGHICQSVCQRITTPGGSWADFNEMDIMQGEINITITILDIIRRPVFYL
jgi:hypothetical protein